jgi:hypothetical protein
MIVFPAFVVLSIANALANAFSAGCDFVRSERVAVGMRSAGIDPQIMPLLGIPKAAAAVGLLVGIAVPPIGTAAAAGLVLFFLAALGVHVRARDYSSSMGLAGGFLLLAAATLALSVQI